MKQNIGNKEEKEKIIERLKEINKIADKLKWILPPYKTSYPFMQLSKVEKCMIAMVDDFELERMRKWLKEVEDGKFIPKYEHEHYDNVNKKWCKE